MQTRSKTKQSKSSRENDANECCGRVNERGCLVVDYSVIGSSRRRRRWSIFDLHEKRWYNLKYEVSNKGHNRVLAMDGGLVCTFVDAFMEEQRRAPNCIVDPVTDEHQTLIMFNLLGGVSKVLPNPPPLGNVYDFHWKLILENASNTFKIFLINMMSRGVNLGHPYFCVYESSTGQWRNLPNPPSADRPYWEQTDIPRNAIFQGLFYHFYESASKVLKLCRFNFLEDSWEDTDVQFLQSNVKSYDLVVSDNRLFLKTEHSISLGTLPHTSMEISEILLADKECRMVFRTEQLEITRFNPSRAVGLNKSILLLGAWSAVMRYVLATGQWELGPQNSSAKFAESEDVVQTTKQMNYLRLPNVPW